MILPADFVPIEMHGMSVITAILLTCFVGVVYYVIRWLHDRISEGEKTSSEHCVEIATVSQSAESVAKSVDIMRKDLRDAVSRIEDRFQQIQSSIDLIKRNK